MPGLNKDTFAGVHSNFSSVVSEWDLFLSIFHVRLTMERGKRKSNTEKCHFLLFFLLSIFFAHYLNLIFGGIVDYFVFNLLLKF